jgi:hypothetical protein
VVRLVLVRLGVVVMVGVVIRVVVVLIKAKGMEGVE